MSESLQKQTILVVDDTPENIAILDEVLSKDYRIKIAINGESALKIATSSTPPDLVLLDVMMPDINGFEVCRRLKANQSTRKIPVIFVTTKGEVKDETKGFRYGGADYITKPISPPIVRERVKTHLALYDQNRVLEGMVQKRTEQLRQALERLKNASLDTIYRLSKAAEYRDEDTGAHILRMSNYSVAVARKMGLNADVVESLLYAAPMHDIGKIGIPDRVLLKPGKLDPKEWEIMKRHAGYGANILEGSRQNFITLGETIALTHHEKWDGSGYPHGLRGNEIPIEGRVVAVADVFDALTSKRPYKSPLSLEKAYAIIKEGNGGHFDPGVVDAFFAAEQEILDVREMYKDSGESLRVLIAGAGDTRISDAGFEPGM